MEETRRAWFWLSLDGNTSLDDVHRLISALTDQDRGISTEPAGAGPGLGDIVLGVTLFATSTVTLANQLLELAEKLGWFRKEQQQRGRPGRIRIAQANGDRVEIEGYSAEEILPVLTAAMDTPQIASLQGQESADPSLGGVEEHTMNPDDGPTH